MGKAPTKEAIRLSWASREVFVTMRDYGGRSFDITAAPPVDIRRRVRENVRGGLGLHLVKQIADRLDWRHVDGRSMIMVRKRLVP